MFDRKIYLACLSGWLQGAAFIGNAFHYCPCYLYLEPRGRMET